MLSRSCFLTLFFSPRVQWLTTLKNWKQIWFSVYKQTEIMLRIKSKFLAVKTSVNKSRLFINFCICVCMCVYVVLLLSLLLLLLLFLQPNNVNVMLMLSTVVVFFVLLFLFVFLLCFVFVFIFVLLFIVRDHVEVVELF